MHIQEIVCHLITISHMSYYSYNSSSYGMTNNSRIAPSTWHAFVCKGSERLPSAHAANGGGLPHRPNARHRGQGSFIAREQPDTRLRNEMHTALLDRRLPRASQSMQSKTCREVDMSLVPAKVQERLGKYWFQFCVKRKKGAATKASHPR